MHVLHRPHLPRLISVSIAAAILAIVISLALASRLSNLNQSTGYSSTSAHLTAPAPSSVSPIAPPRAVGSPFGSLLSRPLPQPWLIARF